MAAARGAAVGSAPTRRGARSPPGSSSARIAWLEAHRPEVVLQVGATPTTRATQAARRSRRAARRRRRAPPRAGPGAVAPRTRPCAAGRCDPRTCSRPIAADANRSASRSARAILRRRRGARAQPIAAGAVRMARRIGRTRIGRLGPSPMASSTPVPDPLRSPGRSRRRRVDPRRWGPPASGTPRRSATSTLAMAPREGLTRPRQPRRERDRRARLDRARASRLPTRARPTPCWATCRSLHDVGALVVVGTPRSIRPARWSS